MATLRSLGVESLSESERLEWLEDTRLDAMLGATSKSQASVRSGVRLWMAFVGADCVVGQHVCVVQCINLCADKYDPLQKRYFPPPLHLLISWTTIFRNGGTLKNYLGYVKTGCMVFNKSVAVCCFA